MIFQSSQAKNVAHSPRQPKRLPTILERNVFGNRAQEALDFFWIV
jgi:hypothetical protein